MRRWLLLVTLVGCDGLHHIRGNAASASTGAGLARVVIVAWPGDVCDPPNKPPILSAITYNDGTFEESFVGPPHPIGPLAVRFFVWEYEKECMVATPIPCARPDYFNTCYKVHALLRPKLPPSQ